MEFSPIPEGAALQTINALTTFEEYLRTCRRAEPFKGGMYWKRQGRYEYLVRTAPDNSQSRVGPRSPETQALYDAFMAQKQAIEQRRASLTAEMDLHRRLNRAHRVGRVPNVLIALLQRLEVAGWSERFTVVGAAALYAYEMSTGLQIAASDLGDAGQRVRLVAELDAMGPVSVLELLQRVDKTFAQTGERYCNSRGFEVEVIASQSRRAASVRGADRICQAVIGVNGAMAMMQVLHPAGFVNIEKWRSKHHADLVRRLVSEMSIAHGLGELPLLKERHRQDAEEVRAGKRDASSLFAFPKGAFKGAKVTSNPRSEYAKPGTGW